MNQIVDIVPVEDDPVNVTDETPTEETESFVREKLEKWQSSGHTAIDMGRGVMFALMMINAAAALVFLGIGVSQRDPVVSEALSSGVELCLIGLGAAAIANLAGFMMQRSVVQTATLNLIETWRNLGNEEYERRESANKSATMLFWVTANFSIISVLLFLQGSWAAKGALI